MALDGYKTIQNVFIVHQKGKYIMKAEKKLEEIGLRELEAAEHIKHNKRFDMQMSITELHFLEYAILSLAISEVDRELEDAGVDIAPFKDSMHQYLDDILVQSVKGEGGVKEFDDEKDMDCEMRQYSYTVEKLHMNILNRYYNALEALHIEQEKQRKVVTFRKREECRR